MPRNFRPPEYISSLIAAINDGAKTAQTGALALAALGIYLAAVALSTTDVDLLLGQTTTITQLGVQVSPGVSFGVSALVFVALHVFTLIRYGMLATNLERFRTDLDDMVPGEADRDRCRQLLANVEFVVSRAADPQSPLYSHLFGWVFIAVIGFFPVVVLIIQHLSALRYQDPIVDLEQHVAMLLELGALVWFLGRLQPPKAVADDTIWTARALGLIRIAAALATIPLLLLLTQYPAGLLYRNWSLISCAYIKDGLGLTWNYWLQHLGIVLDLGVLIWLFRAFTFSRNSWLYRRLLALPPRHVLLLPIFIGLSEGWLLNINVPGDPKVVPDSAVSVAIQPMDHYPFCPNGGCRHLIVTGRFLVGKVWDEKAVAELRGNRYCSVMDAPCTETTFQTLMALEGISLHHQALFHADLNRSGLIGVDSFYAYLADANLGFADLRGANLFGAKLPRANLGKSNLRKSILRASELQNASLNCADLAGADLHWADLRGADMSQADLTGAKLEGVLNLDTVYLAGALYDSSTIFPQGFDTTRRGLNESSPASRNMRQVGCKIDPTSGATE